MNYKEEELLIAILVQNQYNNYLLQHILYNICDEVQFKDIKKSVNSDVNKFKEKLAKIL